jgi:hypothetical protein
MRVPSSTSGAARPGNSPSAVGKPQLPAAGEYLRIREHPVDLFDRSRRNPVAFQRRIERAASPGGTATWVSSNAMSTCAPAPPRVR